MGDLWEAGAAVGARLGGGALLGYSLGGRIALHAALNTPDIERLVLISATAGIDDDAERAERRRADDALADRIGLIGVEAFIEEWLAAPMFARLPPDPDCLAARRANTARGLASSLRTCGAGTQEPLWDRLADLDLPVLVIVGADDTKFTALGRRLCESLQHGQLAVIDGAGHACHSEQPGEVAAVVDRWITS